MDPNAYLIRHGWQGAGHSLHPSGRGIRKPLLVSRKTNVLGVGLKKNDAHADQWWARAFDSSLKSLDVSKNESSGEIERVNKSEWGQLDLVKSGAGKWAGLYDGFVKGTGMVGTITEKDISKPLAKTRTMKISEQELEIVISRDTTSVFNANDDSFDQIRSATLPGTDRETKSTNELNQEERKIAKDKRRERKKKRKLQQVMLQKGRETSATQSESANTETDTTPRNTRKKKA